jgi:transposase-like protein
MEYTIQEFQNRFKDDDVCLDFMFRQHFGDITECPKCNKTAKFYKRKDRKCYACQHCGHCISPLKDTIFEKSSTSLKSWFFVIFLFSNSKNGVSAKEVQRHIGVTYKCAWRMCKQIRRLFDEANHMLSGIIEIDETYIGGKEKNKHASKKTENNQGRSTKTKTAVLGAVEKEGRVVAKVANSTTSSSVKSFLREHVAINTEVHTDEYQSYNNLEAMQYTHKQVNHSKGKYVIGKAHTNNIEGFWSQLKRSVHGTYHCVSRKYLQQYVNEFAFRYNHRKSDIPVFALLLGRLYHAK